jgi:hypothetical protein
MQKIHLACALLSTAIPAIAQCAGSPPPATLRTRDEPAASFYYGPAVGVTAPLVQVFDATTTAPLTITGARGMTYDQGVGNPVVPNQVGALATVNFWTTPTTWVGQMAADPNLGGTAWTLAGTGTMTVTAWPTYSPIAITTPFTLPPGTFGLAIEYLPTTTGPAPGSLHTLGVNPNNLPNFGDSFWSCTNQAIQQVGWSGGINTATGLNFEFDYTPDPAAGYFAQFGDGCYFRPHAFYESFPESASAPDLANTGISMIPLGANYLVTATPSVIVPPASASLTTGAFGASSSASWDDALSAPITLPFTFNYPGGSTGTITIGSNGYIYLDAETTGTFDVCGASYGSLAVFRDNKGRIAAYFHDLDPTVGGGIYYDVDPSNNFVRITWDQCQEWGVPAAVNTMQMTLHASGQVDLAYGVLGNQSAGNNAIAGFTPGNGARLPAAQDLSASMPFQSGDGAIPPVLGMDARPIIGTTSNMVTTNITAGTLFVLQVAGFSRIPAPGLPLAGFGLPGCFLHINASTSALLPVIGGQSAFPLALPNAVSFLGVQLYAQSAPFTAGLNAAGIIASNGMCLKVGQF